MNNLINFPISFTGSSLYMRTTLIRVQDRFSNIVLIYPLLLAGFKLADRFSSGSLEKTGTVQTRSVSPSFSNLKWYYMNINIFINAWKKFSPFLSKFFWTHPPLSSIPVQVQFPWLFYSRLGFYLIKKDWFLKKEGGGVQSTFSLKIPNIYLMYSNQTCVYIYVY